MCYEELAFSSNSHKSVKFYSCGISTYFAYGRNAFRMKYLNTKSQVSLGVLLIRTVKQGMNTYVCSTLTTDCSMSG